MALMVLILFGVIFFIIGVGLVYRGMAHSPDIENVVAKDEFVNVQTRLQQIQQEEHGLKLQLDTMALELQNARVKAEEGERLKTETEIFKKDVDSLRERDRRHQEMIEQLKDNLSFITNRADEQAQKALEVIEALNSKNKKLQTEMQDALSRISGQDIDTLKTEREDLQRRFEENLKKIDGLESELRQVQEKSNQERVEAGALIEKLTLQNKTFEEGIQGITSKISILEQELINAQEEKDRQLQNAKELIDQLRREQQQLKEQGNNPEDLRVLENEIARLKDESEGRLTVARQDVNRLENEVTRLQREIESNQQQRSALQYRIDENEQGVSNMTGDDAKPRREQWLDEKQVMDKELSELRETIEFLRQKERLLSQELLRSQTQAMGLEKICQEFRKQIERR